MIAVTLGWIILYCWLGSTECAHNLYIWVNLGGGSVNEPHIDDLWAIPWLQGVDKYHSRPLQVDLFAATDHLVLKSVGLIN